MAIGYDFTLPTMAVVVAAEKEDRSAIPSWIS